MQDNNIDTNRLKKIFKAFKIFCLVITDIVLVNLSALVSLLVRFEFNCSDPLCYGYIGSYSQIAIFATALAIFIFFIFNLYNSIWEYAGLEEAIRIVASVIVFNAVILLYVFFRPYALPRSYPILNTLILSFSILVCRFGYRCVRILLSRHKKHTSKKSKRTMLIGGGSAAATIIRDTKNAPRSTNDIICIIDKDPDKQGKTLNGVRIVGGNSDIVSAAAKYKIDEIIIALPRSTAKERQELIEICNQTGCTLRTLPAVYQLASGDVSIQKIRKVDVEDLLGRDSVKVDNQQISGYVKGKTVLVTGGGGSIGSELCRQIASSDPARIIVFDIYENNAYALQQELRSFFPDLELTVLIGSVRDTVRLCEVFEKYHPEIVYHAAAHKHVPLMEDSPVEAIKNNVFGTYNTAEAAHKYGAETFILISTDKAVNPTNIMGASKRICEMVVQYFASLSDTKFAAVRFGNVLGSNGSVIPLFKKQIERGGPVTVTHPDIIRYFMTIPEAVSLVLQAGAYANNGEIFVLDMGEPVRIDDLARNMIRLSGFEPDVDIKIEYTGLRDGEKLYEELLLSGEGLGRTPNNLIFIGHPQKKDDDLFKSEMEELKNAFSADPETLRALIQRIVPEYHPELGGKH